MKKSLAVVAAIAAASVLTVTAAGCSGCSNKSRNLASLSSNWYYDTGFKGIQPTFTGEDAAEVLTYSVAQTQKSTNTSYQVEYAEGGTYKTTFYAKQVDEDLLKDITHPDWYGDYEDALGSEGYMYLYYYATELYIPSVTYKFGTESAKFDDQTVVTESYFLSVADYLTPVYSKRVVDRAIPANDESGSLEGCYAEMDMVYESFYKLYGNDVKTYITDNNAEKDEDRQYEYGQGGLNGHANSVFDLSTIDVALRAMRNMSSSLSLTVGIYTPGLAVRDYTISGSNRPLLSDAEKSNTQLAEVQSLLQNDGLFTPKTVKDDEGNESETVLNTVAVTVAYNGGSFSGVSQTYWFAVDEEKNETRTLMVKYSEPLTYNLGTVEYVLESIDNFPVD